MRIYLLDSSLNILCELDSFVYCAVTKHYYRPSMFELRLSRRAWGAEYALVGNYVWVRDEYLDFVGRIEYEEIELTEQGIHSEVWTKKGYDISGIFYHRLCMHNIAQGSGYDEQTGNAEAVMKHYVDVNVVNPSDQERAVSLLQIASNQNRGDTVTYRARLQSVAEALEDIAKTSGVGWSISFDADNKVFVFDVAQGEDKSSIVKLSPDFGNLRRLRYVYDALNTKNLVVVGNAGEDATRIFLVYPTENAPSGLSRREVFADARDLNDAQLVIRAKETLAGLGVAEQVEAEHLPQGTFLYGRDFVLGDIVKVIYPGVVSADARVISVLFEYTTRDKSSVTVRVGRTDVVGDIYRYQRRLFMNEVRR